MTRVLTGAMLALTLMLGSAARPEAHEQRFMGFVAAVEGAHLQITTTDGKSMKIMLDEKTKIVQGKIAKKPGDIKPGARIVVTTTDAKDKDGKMMLIAKQIRLGTAAPVKTTRR